MVLALDPGMAFGTGLHPTTRLCLAGDRGLGRPGDAGASAAAGARRACSTSAAARGSWRSPPACSGRDDRARASTPIPIAVEATIANARRNRLGRRIRARQGSLPSGDAAVRPGPGQPHRRRCSSRSRPRWRPSCGRVAGCSRRASSSTARPRSRRRSRRPGWSVGRGRPRATGSRSRPSAPAERPGHDPAPRRSGGRPGRRPTIRRRAPSSRSCCRSTSSSRSRLFLPSLLLPFALRTRPRRATESKAGLVRFLLRMQAQRARVADRRSG